jgi:hypothetical protein
MTALGVLLVAGFAALSASLVAGGNRTVAVLALARDVPAGHVVVPGDLRIARISGSGVSALAASAQTMVVGETATSSLPAGTLLTSAMLTRDPVPAAGAQVVAVAVKSGLVPSAVTAGRDVSLVLITPLGGRSAGGSGAGGVLVPSARVVDVSTDPTTGSTMLSVVVSSALAPQVAQASAGGELAVTLLPVTP